MQFAGESAPIELEAASNAGDVPFFPPSLLDPRLNSFSKLPLIFPPGLVLLSSLPYGLVTEMEGREVTVDLRGLLAPIGNNGSRLCLFVLGMAVALFKSSVDERLILLE